jgi:DnaK suppressor protein
VRREVEALLGRPGHRAPAAARRLVPALRSDKLTCRYDDVMDPSTDLDAARVRLLAERARLRSELGQEIEAPGQMTYGSQAAAAAQVFAQQRDLAFREQAERRLHAVEHALARLEAGTYAICQVCGGAISAERHEVIPWCTTCVACGRTYR